jgi:hypothetical protein
MRLGSRAHTHDHKRDRRRLRRDQDTGAPVRQDGRLSRLGPASSVVIYRCYACGCVGNVDQPLGGATLMGGATFTLAESDSVSESTLPPASFPVHVIVVGPFA